MWQLEGVPTDGPEAAGVPRTSVSYMQMLQARQAREEAERMLQAMEEEQVPIGSTMTGFDLNRISTMGAISKESSETSAGFLGEAENAVEKLAPVTTGGGDFAFRAMLFGIVVMLDTYGPLLQNILVSIGIQKGLNPPFDWGGMPLNVCWMSIVIALVLVIVNREYHILFAPGCWLKIVKYGMPGFGFLIVTYINSVTLGFVDLPMRTVMHQMRLPITAALSMCILGRKYTSTEWLMFTVVALAAATYGFMSMYGGNQKGAENTNASVCVGGILSMMAIVIFNLVGVFMQKFMQDERATPFHIQKIYMELLGGLVAGFLFNQYGAAMTGPLFQSVFLLFGQDELASIAKKRLDGMTGSQWLYHPLYRTDEFLMLLYCAVWVMKGWSGGVMVKHMSHLDKVLGQTITLVFSLVANQVHVKCPPDQDGQKRFWCPRHVRHLNPSQICAAILVAMAVLGAVWAGSDKQREADLKEEVARVKQALLDKKWQKMTA